MGSSSRALVIFAAALAILAIAPPALGAKKACKDIPPDEFPCSKQKIWGKCVEPWMIAGNFCAKTCDFCGKESVQNGELEEEPVEVVEPGVSAPTPPTQPGEAKPPFDGFDSDCKTVMQTISQVPDFGTLSAILEGLKGIDEELLDILSDEDSRITVFIPTNEAFEPYFETLGLTGGAEPDAIQKVLRNHIIPSVHHSRTLKTKTKLPTLLEGEEISVTEASPIEIKLESSGGQAGVTLPNIWACRSILHVIDDVLLPKKI